MAPSPENDNTPKAPDKNEKTKGDKHGSADVNKEKNKDFKTLNNLNDCELKDLLDEAITYKNPKDREGKSTLFKELLSQAEESERNARAASAGGSEQVRYCNTTAKRSKHRRKPNSISENVMHGGSLDNLAKEELFEVAHHLNRPKRTVSARQREGGSLPSNVNSGGLASYDPHFLEEARRKRTVKGTAGGNGPPVVEAMDVDLETVSLLEHDSVAENFDKGPSTLELIENAPPQSAPKFTTKATLQVNVDDALHFNDLEAVEKKPFEIEQISAKVLQSKYSVYIPNYNPLNEVAKKVDENGNALHQNTTSKSKKKKIQSDKNVVSCVAAEKVEGHRSDIINDVKKLLEFIGENKPQGGTTNKTNAHRSSKQLHKHTSEEGPRSSKKQRAQSSKGKENRPELKKSNSLGEISTVNLENFAFGVNDGVDKNDVGRRQGGEDEVVLRSKKEHGVDKPRERRSWGNVEHPTMQNFYKNPSTENIETSSSSDFRVVTKKKKTKKRRNSISGSRRKMSAVASNGANSSKSDGDRASSPPVVRRKSTCSVPHSDRSNDSSDVDSVHSLPIDASQRLDSNLNSEDAPISYADIARNSERKTPHEFHKKTSPEAKTFNFKESSPVSVVSMDPISPEAVRSKATPHHVSDALAADVAKPTVLSQTTPLKAPPPDVHNIKSFPAIHVANNKLERLAKVENKASNARTCNNKLHQQGRQQNMVQCNNVANVNRNSRNQSNDVANEDLEHQDDIQNDLSIIQSNEMDAIQYNSQIMPTMQIPDVQTIEKIHFMSQPGGHMPPHLQQHVVPPQHVHMTPPHPHHLHHINHHLSHAISMVPMTDMFANGRSPPAYTAVISHTPHQPGGVAYIKAAQAYEGVGVAYLDHAYLSASKGAVKEGLGARVVPNVVETRNVLNNNLVTVTTQTNSVETTKRKDSISGKTTEDENANSAIIKQNKMKFSKKSHFQGDVVRLNNSGNRDISASVSPSIAKTTHASPSPTVVANSDASSSSSLVEVGVNRQGPAPTGAESSERDASSAANCDSRTNASECASSEDSSRPPVVILSGLNSSKEVTSGLVFGFDVNEQLLSDDICENFVQRFVIPVTFTESSHNHDKIVNYIGLAWDEVRKSHSLGKAQYYSDTL